MSDVTLQSAQAPVSKGRTRRRRSTSLFAHGEPLVWLTGGSLALCLMMVLGLLAIVVVAGGSTFLVRPIERLELHDGTVVIGQVTNIEHYAPVEGDFDDLPEDLRPEIPPLSPDGAATRGPVVRRRLLRTGNFEVTNTHFQWVADPHVRSEGRPESLVTFERHEWGRFYGEPVAFLVDGEVVAEGFTAAHQAYLQHHPDVIERLDDIAEIEHVHIGRVAREIEDSRLAMRAVEISSGADSPEYAQAREAHERLVAQGDESFVQLRAEIGEIAEENDKLVLRVRDSAGNAHDLPLATIVRAVPSNGLGLWGATKVYLARWGEFLSAEPRHSNSEGGVYPAIIGTVLMTLIMAVLVVPFGVMAALYLHEYAKQGALVSIVRIAVNNLAGVPSIVFGVFGLGFFCYIVGVRVDELFFQARLPNPTYAKGGVLWASLTLALLTLPVVIVATEEALAAVPGSMREGSYACGATKWQTIRRIVLPRALPGILTGTILAIARGAGEVAPLMLVGAVKLAPDLPVDLAQFPYVFPERSFMHLGFHIYDVGFQSQNSEAARPLVFTTTLLLISIVVLLNIVAMQVRSHLRKRYSAAR